MALLSAMRIVTIPCMGDNYSYLIIDQQNNAVAVDPSSAQPVRDALAKERAHLRQIWLTHHHFDHTGGVDELTRMAPSLEVCGSSYDLQRRRIHGQTRGLGAEDSLFFDGHRVTILELPGHTLGSIGYLVSDNLFSGDTLFLAGCGRLFEGDAASMQRSLAKLRTLAPNTLVYCGHEYTIYNLKFAKTIEPKNPEIDRRIAWAQGLRKNGEPTVPGTIAGELATNPFLRWDVEEVIRAVGDTTCPVSVFGAIRRAKDDF